MRKRKIRNTLNHCWKTFERKKKISILDEENIKEKEEEKC